MGSVLVSSAVDRSCVRESGKFIFAAIPHNQQYSGITTKTGWFRIGIMSPCGATWIFILQ
jgi:hypothetical protein